MRQALVAVSIVVAGLGAHAAVIDFEDVPGASPVNTPVAIPDGYYGFDWTNFYVQHEDRWPGTGYDEGTVSGSWASFNGFGTMAAAGDMTFNLLGAWFTPAWLDVEYPGGRLDVSVLAYDNGVEQNSTVFSLYSETPVWVAFGWYGIDQVVFASTSYSANGSAAGPSQFVMDDFTYTQPAPGPGPVIPAPGAIVLGMLGVSCVGWLRRRSAM